MELSLQFYSLLLNTELYSTNMGGLHLLELRLPWQLYTVNLPQFSIQSYGFTC